MTIISLNGNIGAGKSTLMGKLEELYKENDKIIIVKEPVDVWEGIKDEQGVGLLENFYKNQAKFAFSFQMTAYISLLALLKKTRIDHPDKVIIVERCMNSSRNIFAKMLHDDGLITLIDNTIYNQWYNEFINELGDIKYVYLKIDAEECLRRIKKRNRKGEDNISLNYLKKVEKYHDDWLLQKEMDTIILNDNTDLSFVEKLTRI